MATKAPPMGGGDEFFHRGEVQPLLSPEKREMIRFYLGDTTLHETVFGTSIREFPPTIPVHRPRILDVSIDYSRN